MNQSSKRIKRVLRNLSAALIVSIVLNVILISYISYVKLESFSLPSFAEEEQLAYDSLTVNLHPLDAYHLFDALSQEELIRHLTDKRWVEDGLKMRDLALAVLVEKNGFDIQRGLGHLPESRIWQFENIFLPIFLSVSDAEFVALEAFGKREQWPILPQKMLQILQEKKVSDPRLEETFMLTESFQKLARALSKADVKLVLQMVLEGDWELLNSVSEHPTSENRQKILLAYLDKDSPAAALLLLQLEPYFAFKQLDDDYVLKTLRLLKERNALTVKFALSMLASPRGEAVKELAMQRLASFTEKTAFLTSLLPQKPKPGRAPSEPIPPFKQGRNYTVQSGDNLWKIAKRCNVSLSELKKHNRLTDDDVLQPGLVLKIP